ncbi:MAG: undecaprenyl-diphosphate phosphatase [Kiritimatiellae bacterium]|nr:undecaprenyl-diphosphate phosphatase [Kiritimatiellia bacterium]
MTEFLDVTVLSILQGIAEFLPISSSGHLVIGQHLLGLDVPGMRLDLMLHFGTLISICVFYWRTIWRIIAKFEWQYVLKIVLSALPAVVVYFFFKDFIDGLFENAKMVGALLMFTGAILIGTRYLPRGSRDVCWKRALLMGCAQALALLPGVSRSGMTLASARGGRIEAEKAAEFSFLMSAPLIVGGVLLEILKAFRASPAVQEAEISWGLTIYGAALAAVVGYFSLVVLLKALKGRWFWLFGPYCLAAGLLTLILV